MFINEVISYGGAWQSLINKSPSTLNSVKSAIFSISDPRIQDVKPRRPVSPKSAFYKIYRFEAYWQELMEERGWLQPPSLMNHVGRRLSPRLVGHVDQGVSVTWMRNRDLLNRWIYSVCPIAVRAGYFDIPVAIVFQNEAQEQLFERVQLSSSQLFEEMRDELVALSPLSHGTPFVIIGVSIQPISVPNVIELSSEQGVDFRQIVVNRSIEFPPQYHQAGLGILNYFGSVLREKYPDHDAKVRIEQDGLTVRLIIESVNGDREIIEKALQEYELVVRGEAQPESLFSSPIKVLELKNELRIAQVRIDSQRDIIQLQNQEILSLRQLIGHTLSHPVLPQSINLNPIINIENTVSQSNPLTISIPEIVDELEELCSVVDDESLRTKLLDLQESMESSGNRGSAAEVRVSSGIKKLRKLLEDASTVGTKANDILSKVENGISLIQSLGKKYNAIAEWCGAPQIPRIFMGE